MPDRILRAAINDSKKVASVSIAAELLYRKLMSLVDDFGRFELDFNVIYARTFSQRLSEVSIANVSEWINECREAGLIQIYSVGPKNFLQVENFKQKTRTASKFPNPPSCEDSCEQMSANEFICGPRAPNTNTNTNTNSFSSSQENSKAESSLAPKKPDSPLRGEQVEWFQLFWNRYWRKVGRDAAAKAFAAKVRTADEFVLTMEALEAQTPEMRNRPADKIPYPATWLNRGSMHDEPMPLAALSVVVGSGGWGPSGNGAMSFAERERQFQNETFRRRLQEELEEAQ